MGHNSHWLYCWESYLKDACRRCHRDCLVIGNVEIHRSGRDFVWERSLEGHVRLIVSYCLRSQRQSGCYVLLISGMDPEAKIKSQIILTNIVDEPLDKTRIERLKVNTVITSAESCFPVCWKVCGSENPARGFGSKSMKGLIDVYKDHKIQPKRNSKPD